MAVLPTICLHRC